MSSFRWGTITNQDRILHWFQRDGTMIHWAFIGVSESREPRWWQGVPQVGGTKGSKGKVAMAGCMLELGQSQGGQAQPVSDHSKSHLRLALCLGGPLKFS